MLHILWMALKFILILLGTVLGLIVLLLLLVLFCPVCYRFAVAKRADEGLTQIQVNGRVSWLFRGISLKASYKSGNLEQDIFLFGIPLRKVLSGLRRRKKNDFSEKAETLPEVISKPEEFSDSDENFEEELDDWLKSEPVSEVKEEQKTAPAGNNMAPKKNISSEKKTKQSERKSRKEPAKKKISLTIRNICDKIKKQRAFFSDQRTKDAVSLVWSDAKGLVIHVLPTRMEGEITFGCEDPSITGTILAILGISVPFHKNKIAVKPLFEDRNVLEGKVQAKGRIFVCVLVKIAIEIYFNKNVKYIINQWKHKEG